MRRLSSSLLMVLLAAAPAAASPRAASIGLCGDQALTALLDDKDIAALSPQARDPQLSAVAGRAAHLPVIAPSAEAVLMTGATIVAANAYGELKTVSMLQRLGVTVIRVPSAETFEDVSASLLAVGDALGAHARAESVVDDLGRRRQALSHVVPPAALPAAYLRPDGGSAGSGTFVAAAMAAAGLDSLASRLGRHGWGRLDLETLVKNAPRAFVLSFFSPGPYSARQAFGRHPLLRQMMVTTPVIAVPGRLWSCGGWPLIEAAEYMWQIRQDKDIR